MLIAKKKYFEVFVNVVLPSADTKEKLKTNDNMPKHIKNNNTLKKKNDETYGNKKCDFFAATSDAATGGQVLRIMN